MNDSIPSRMRSPEPRFGTWLSLGSPVVAEMAAQCGFDWLLIDMEHGCLSEASVLPMLQAIAAHPVATVVRVPSHEPTLIARVLDWGANAIMAPHVSNAEEARALVRAMRYPPHGTRGFSRTVRVYGYGQNPPGSVPPPLLFAQIESVEAVENADEIAEVEGVDVLFVGPADLQLSLSLKSGGPNYEESLDRVATAARKHHRQAGLLIRDTKDTGKLLKQGFTKLAVGSDMSLLRAGFILAATKPSGFNPEQ